MIQSLLVVAVLALPAWSTPAAGARQSFLLNPTQQEALGNILVAAQNWTSVHLRARTGNFLEVHEPFLRISLNGHKNGSNYYTLSGYVDREYLNLSARPRFGNDMTRGFSLWGSGVSVDVTPSGRDGWRVWGNAGSSTLSLHITRSGSGHYNIWGDGAGSLNASAFSDSVNINGSVDLTRFGPKPLGLLGFVLAVIHDTPTQP